MGPAAATEISRQQPRNVNHPSGSEQRQASSNLTPSNLQSHTGTEHSKPSSGSRFFNNYDSGALYATTGGYQFPGTNFHGPVNFNQPSGYQKDPAQREKEIRILKCLDASPYKDRKDRNPPPVQGTCHWFVSHEHFRDWQERKSSAMLWVSADPGCGKSVLAKHLVDSVLLTTESRTVCYFFFKDDFEDQRSAVCALCCILHQLFVQKRILLSDAILDQFDIVGEKFTSSFGELWQALINAASDKNAGEIVCLLDAIDECEAQGRSQLDLALRKLYETKRSFNLKFLLTSRPYGEIHRDFQPIMIPGLPVIHLSGESDEEVKKISREIDIFIKARVQDIGAQLKLTHRQLSLLLEELMRVPNRTYLWVHLTLKLIEDDVKIDKTGIIQATSHLPQTVDEAYDRILSKSYDSEKAKKILHIVVAAARPLTLREMNLALALRESDRSYPDLDLRPENRFSQDGLTTLMIASYFGLRTVVKHLLKEDGRGLNDQDATYQRSALSWAAGNGFDGVVKLLTKSTGVGLKGPKLLFGEGADVDSKSKDGRTPLSYGAWNGNAAVVKRLIKAGARVDAKDDIGGTPSSYAVCNGRKEVIKLLLKEGSQVDSEDNIIKELLFSAAKQGHEEIVGLLLETDKADADAKDDTGWTPLMSAAANGHGAVVKLLLEKGANADAKDNTGWTPLGWAAEKGHEVIVKLLLEKGVSPDAKDDTGWTPLGWAAKNGQEAIVKLLLEKGVNADIKDNTGRTPLGWAAANGHEVIVKLLLEKGANADAKDDTGWTPLGWAAKNGHEAIIKLLLEKGANADAKDDTGWTPLGWAAKNGYEVIVKLLLEKGVDADEKDDTGWRPLTSAAANGHGAVVKLLLEKGANADAKDSTGWTPLGLAVVNGYEVIIKLLPEIGASADAKDGTGWTPLGWAAKNGQEAIIKLLLEKGGNADIKDNTGRTPLGWAAANGQEAIVKLVLEKGVNADIKDNTGRTPLGWAAANGHGAIVKLLLKKGANADAKDGTGWTPLWLAAENGNEVIIKLLLEKGANADVKGNAGWTPLGWAAKNGHEAIIKLLLEKGVNANAKDDTGWTPLL
ncbi:hypothetical protein DL764_008235 [Monosporascus ibericus]|uniref:Nephrocystin 3-like N-terminal domain-containing protein n=1 Tax=Monosporascus ibericus TaxID=155417 RepID=A0A4Q4T0U1_9PEZI|nr:hypothetical protein DL764_008235 [Monosporascus ibericus]